jgi:putative cell wall-binding protein
MKTMNKIILMLLCLLLFALPVLAQSQTYSHEVTVELDGEWDFNSSFVSPEVTSNTALVGIGKARIYAITKAQSVPVWWELF